MHVLETSSLETGSLLLDLLVSRAHILAIVISRGPRVLDKLLWRQDYWSLLQSRLWLGSCTLWYLLILIEVKSIALLPLLFVRPKRLNRIVELGTDFLGLWTVYAQLTQVDKLEGLLDVQFRDLEWSIATLNEEWISRDGTLLLWGFCLV